MSFAFLAVGCFFVLSGLAYLAYLMQLPEAYVLASGGLLLTLFVATGIQSARGSRI